MIISLSDLIIIGTTVHSILDGMEWGEAPVHVCARRIRVYQRLIIIDIHGRNTLIQHECARIFVIHSRERERRKDRGIDIRSRCHSL